MSQLEITEVIAEAKRIANQVANQYLQQELNGEDKYACGFAWVNIYGIRANSKVGKQLIALGIKKDDYYKSFMVWNPSEVHVQNIDTKEIGAQAFAKVLRDYGLKAYAYSRLD
jgi:hypothetical protein